MAHKKNKKLRIRHLIMIILIIYIFSIFINQQRIINKLGCEVSEKEKIIEELKQEIKDLEEEEKIVNSPEHMIEYIEKVAREELKMVKPGEVIYIDKNKQQNRFSE